MIHQGARVPRRPAPPGGADDAPPPSSDDLAFERLVFFSDAVFAIAITLLVIEVRLPALPADATEADVIAGIRATLPQIFAYVLSFATIGLYWLAHWRRFRYIVHVDSRLVAYNLVLLGFIAFIPFPTAVLGEHGDLVPAVVLYAVVLSAAGVVGPLTWLYAWRAGLAAPGLTDRYALLSAARGFSVPVVMLGSLLFLPVVGTTGVEVLWLLIAPVQMVLNRVVRISRADTATP
jgi:uncharacterized membrane protein